MRTSFLKRLSALACAGALLLSAVPGAGAVQYSDLSPSHWAYADMMEAVDRGILKGMGDGTMAPEGKLTWGQYLVMLSRAFAPDYYAALMADGDPWDVAGLYTALDGGILPDEDFIVVTEDTLDLPITRQDVAVLLDRAIPQISNPIGWSETAADTQARSALSDYARMNQNYREPLARLYSLGVVKGKTDGTFGGGDTLRRADGTVLLIRALDLPREPQPTPTPKPTPTPTPTPKPTPTPTPAPTPTGSPAPTETAQPSPPPAYTGDPALRELGDNAAKRTLLYGNALTKSFSSRSESEAHMTTITVPVWKLNKATGEKTPSELTFRIHQALAQDVIEIFTEIYNDPEQFPVRSAGGYSWRGGGSSEHNWGTAIDISATENYQVRDGRAMTGTHWTPGEDPFSIPEDGSVVRIFHEHGWTWGGADWAGHSDPNVGYHDYMHFSYLGR